MTKEQAAMLKDTKDLVHEAKILMAKAEEKIEAAAEVCKGFPMEDQLNSIFDELTDLRFDLGKQLDTFEKRLNGEGNDAPESWSA